MKAWPVQDAKARFSELLETCQREGPQLVTKRGADAAVLVPIAEWERIRHRPGRSLKEILLAKDGPRDLHIPPRGKLKLRPPPKFE